jgi:hypothetical protein
LLQQVGFLADGTTQHLDTTPAAGNNVNQIDDAGLNSSRWQIQTGVRYTLTNFSFKPSFHSEMRVFCFKKSE